MINATNGTVTGELIRSVTSTRHKNSDRTLVTVKVGDFYVVDSANADWYVVGKEFPSNGWSEVFEPAKTETVVSESTETATETVVKEEKNTKSFSLKSKKRSK